MWMVVEMAQFEGKEKHMLGALCEDLQAVKRDKYTNRLHFPAHY